MSMLLWIDEAADEAIDLGDPFRVFAVLGELHGIDPDDRWAELQAIPEFAEQDPDAEWLGKARDQAAAFLKAHREELSDEAVEFLNRVAGTEEDEPADDTEGAGERQFAAATGQPPIVIKNIINMPEPPAPAPVVVPPPVVLYQKGEKGDPGDAGKPGEKGDKGDRGEAVVTVEQVKPQPPKPFTPKQVIVHRDEVSGEVDVLDVREKPKKPADPAARKE